MIQIAIIETDKAERLMKALCNHFARKITARYEGDKGYIEFGDGKCEITATSSTLKFLAESDTARWPGSCKTGCVTNTYSGLRRGRYSIQLERCFRNSAGIQSYQD